AQVLGRLAARPQVGVGSGGRRYADVDAAVAADAGGVGRSRGGDGDGRVVVVNGKIGDVGTAVGAADGDGVGACRNVADVLRGGAVRPDVGVGRRRTVHRDVDVAVGEVAGGGCGHARNG